MAHARETIRKAFATAISGTTTVSTRVYTSRVYPHDALPCASVYSLAEAMEPDESYSTMEYIRHLEIVVEGRAKAASGMDDTLDDIAGEVEYAVLHNGPLAALVTAVIYRGVDIEIDDELEKPSGVVRVTFEVLYTYAATTPL